MKSIPCTMALVMCCGWIAHGQQLVETNHVIKSMGAQPAPLLNNPSQALTNLFLFSGAINGATQRVPMVITNRPLSLQAPRGNANGLERIVVTNQSGNVLVFALPPKGATNAAAPGSASPSLKPGTYQTQPYSMIVKAPGKHPDETIASRAPEITSVPEAPMPVIKPELRFVPRK